MLSSLRSVLRYVIPKYQSYRSVVSSNPALRRAGQILFWMPIPIVFIKHGFVVYQVTGVSMQPTLNPDLSLPRDVILFDRFSIASLRDYRRGDIVACRSPHNSRTRFVKRLIALPGDTVKTLPPYPDKEVVIPEGHCWIEGDSSFDSDDSNRMGPIPLALVEARMTTILWPRGRHFAFKSLKDSRAEQARELRRISRVTVASSRPDLSVDNDVAAP